MAQTPQAKLIAGPIGKILLKLSAQMLVGIFAMMAFNLVDTFFVGRLGTTELAAMSFTFPVVFVIGSVALGLGVGASAVVSRAIGAGDQGQVRRLTTDSLILSVLIVSALVIAGMFTIDPLFRALGAKPEILPLIRQYMRIWYAGMVFVVVPMVGNNCIRATGDTKTPSVIMVTAVCVNGILDPLLIFGVGPFPKLALAGAAIATVFARLTTFTVSLCILYRREHMISFSFPRLSLLLDSWKRVLSIGIPTALSNVIIPFTIGVITRLVAGYGREAVAGFGVATRVEGLAFTIVIALFTVMGPFIGQNRGAARFDRVRKGIQAAQGFVLGWGALALGLLALAGEPIAVLFNDDPQVIATAVLFFRVAPIGYGFLGVLRICSSALNVLNRAVHATILSIIQAFIFHIPLAMLGSKWFGLPGIFGASVIANITVGTGAFLWLKRVLRIEEKELV